MKNLINVYHLFIKLGAINNDRTTAKEWTTAEATGGLDASWRQICALDSAGLQFVIVVFPDHTHLLFLMSRLLCLCCVVTVKSFPVLALNVVIITIVRIYT